MVLFLSLCAPAVAAAHKAKPKPEVEFQPAPNAERLSHGRFSELVAYQPKGTPSSFAVFFSGDAGWSAREQALVQPLVDQGALVAGVDTRRLLPVLEQDGGDCAYTAGDLENLSHFVQAYYKVPTYLPPILAGVGAGATLAYANLAQAPAHTFGGAVLLDFAPEIGLRKALCKGAALDVARTADGTRQRVQADAQRAALSLLSGKDGRARYAQTYEQLAATLKPTVAAPPAGLDGLPVIEVPPRAGVAEADVFAVLISGDGGWAGLDQEVAGALSAHGIPVVGVDSLRYFWTPRTPASTAADADRIIRYYLHHWHKQQVLLVGYSQGADVMPFIINRLPPETRRHVALGAVMGLSEHALFEFHVGNWVNATQDQGLPTAPEMEKPGDVAMLCIYGEGETDTLCPKLDPNKVLVVKLKGGHHFGGDYERLAREILNAAKLPELAAVSGAAGQTSAVSSDQSQVSNQEEPEMTVHVLITPLLSLIAGILILVMPRLLNYIVAIYLIVVGALGLLGHIH